MDHRHPPSRRPAIAVTLVTATRPDDAARVAAALAGTPRPAAGVVFERSGDDSGRFAVEVAEDLARQADDGETGSIMLTLEPGVDAMEFALVLEHVLEQRHPHDTRIGIADVVAVTSVAEILHTLFGRMPGDAAVDSGGTDLGTAERLACRLEFAGVIVLTGPLEHAPDVDLVITLLRKLSPGATLLPAQRLAEHSTAPVRLTPHRAHRLGSSLGWQRELNGAPAADLDSSSIRTFVFRDVLPFHPERLSAAVGDGLVPARVGRIIRSRGLVRLATRPDRVGSWATAGDVLALDPTSMRSWDSDAPIGQELVFFGQDLDRDALTGVLQGCLLTPDELLAGPVGWSTFSDPFPQWENEHHH